MDTIKNSDDPRLTAYALGELDASERAAVEAFLEQSPEGRAQVEETRALAGLLTSELGGESEPGLTEAHHRELDAALAGERSRGGTVLQLRLWLPAAAAVLVIGFVGWQLATEGPAYPVPVTSSEVADVALEDGRNGKSSFDKGGAYGNARDARSSAPEMTHEELESLMSVGYLGSGGGGGAAGLSRDDAPVDFEGGAVFADEGTVALLEKNERQVPQALDEPVMVEDHLAFDADLLDAGESAALPSLAQTQQEAARGALNVQLGKELPRKSQDPQVTIVSQDPQVPQEQAGAFIIQRQLAAGTGAKPAPPGSPTKPPASVGGRVGVLREGDALPTDNVVVDNAVSAGAAAARGREAPAQQPPARPATTPATTAPVAKGPSVSPSAIGRLEALGYVDGTDLREKKRRTLSELGYLADRTDRRERTNPLRRRMTGGESYAPIHENPFVPLTGDPMSRLSTFGVDVDTASYANVRRFLNMGQAPPPDAVRLEELLNYFAYDDPAPGDEDEVPFAVSVESAAAPWAPEHRLVRIALKGAEHVVEERPASNLVFLLDVSGSMKSNDKLPLLVASLKLLLAELDGDDRVAIVTYASGTRLVLPSTPCSDKPTILAALDQLTANGSTHASAGIQQAYQVASQGFIEGGINRVLLATDGDFNVGITEEGDLEQFIATKARGGVFLTVLGFGTGNLQDSKAEILADRGNGNYAYIDTLNEAHKVLVRELGGTLITIAKDVKLQVEFNPGKVAAYRQLGYENRALAATDFRDDRKDAGEIGAGHGVVALYEVVPVGVTGVPGTADLRYGQAAPEPEAAPLVESDDLLTVNLRYKLPEEATGRELAVPFVDAGTGFTEASDDFRFCAAVASFGMVLRHSSYQGETTLAGIAAVAEAARGADRDGYRSEFVRLVRVAQGLPGF